MGNALTDILDEVSRLKQPIPTPPIKEEVPVQPSEQGHASPQPVDPGPPRLDFIELRKSIVVSNIGNFTLDDKERTEIITICLRALARSLRHTFTLVAQTHGIETPKRTGLTVMATELPKVDGTPPA